LLKILFYIYKCGFSFFRRKKSRLKERSVARLPFSRPTFQNVKVTAAFAALPPA